MASNKRIIAVGTTVVRALESSARKNNKRGYSVASEKKETRLYIHPGYRFKIINGLLTNFHLPRSTNLILVSTFAGVDFIRRAYQYAQKEKFRFYSFGDAMFVA